MLNTTARPKTTSLSTRQITMMGIGGAIGAGLFIGSGQAVAVAGPSIILAFALAGLLVILIMNMLGEMAAANPSSGSFSVYATRAMGPNAGAIIGWLYWIQGVIVIAAEATGAAAIVGSWFPHVSQGTWSLIFVALLTAVNLANVARFGQFEYWFSFLKVAAIMAFLAVGIALVFGLVPGVEATGISNLVANGGFLPNGVVGLCAGLLMVIFAFGGIEIVAIAAAESDDPRTSIRKAVRGVLFRVLVFYVGSALVMVSVLPWASPELAASPFVAVLTFANIPWIDSIMALVVVVALLSAMNANIYAASRMLLSLSERGIAPRVIQRRSRSNNPYVAVAASVILCSGAVVMNYVAPDVVMPMLLNAVGSTLLVTWGFIALSQLILRIRADRDPSIHLPVRMPLFPYLSILALLMLSGIVVLALFDPASRTQLLMTLGLTVVIGVLNALAQRRSQRRGSAGSTPNDSAAQRTEESEHHGVS
ncbi:amino acid permease [Paeniglutamicibacter terrestris]|uniref:Amino acid permease n=1 Tax=Paeniglutamicibacter terrestris TaxID=2723403 RepID=A0ABX1G4V9_9MICC|nr:amino acid permease [Paeniglutamicibacter terrestris]NKG21282.1 amino acid permease [Paeniglutamicibacter terrestris]